MAEGGREGAGETAPVRVGFIGAGGNARSHMRAMEKVSGAVLVALADPSEQAREAAGEQVAEAMTAYADYEEMLESEDLDAVVISTPHTLHAQQAVDALERGLHVLLEKPMACSTAEAERIMAAEAESGCVLMLGYQRHLDTKARWAREQIAANRIGAITYIQAYQGQNWREGTQGTWRQVPALSGGGQLNDSGSHLVDAVLWISGLKPESVAAALDHRGTPVDINSSVTIRFSGGALGSLAVVGDQIARGMWEDMTFAGEDGIIYLRGRGGDVYLATRDDMTPRLIEDVAEAWPSRDQHFIDCIGGKADNQIPSVCGLRVAQLTEAAWRSAETGRFEPVHV